MDYLNRLDDSKEVNATYYEIVYDLIQTKINQHYEHYHDAPRYLLVGESKLWEVARIIFYKFGYSDIKENYTQVFYDLLNGSGNYFSGLKILVVYNDPSILEVV